MVTVLDTGIDNFAEGVGEHWLRLEVPVEGVGLHEGVRIPGLVLALPG